MRKLLNNQIAKMFKKANKKIFALVLVFSFFWDNFVIGMTSSNYEIPWDSLNVGGGENLSSTNYQLESSVGQSASGISTSTNFGESGGYQQLSGTTLKSQNWRFFHDEEKETPQTPAATENVAPNNIARGNALKLRITIKETGGINISNLKLRLQYSTSSDFSWAEFVDEVSCPNQKVWCYFDGGGDDNATITQRVLSDSDTEGTHNESGISTSSYTILASSSAEFEFTIFNNGAPTGTTFYFRVYDNTNQEPVLTNNATYTYPSLVVGESSLSFTVYGLPAGTTTEGVTTDYETSPTSTYFDNLPLNQPKNAAFRFEISTNGEGGYKLFVWQSQNLTSDEGTQIQPASSTNEYPAPWSSACPSDFSSCYGYHTGDDSLSDIGLGPARFSPDDSFARFETQMKEIGFNPYPISQDIFDLIFRIEVRNLQNAGSYQTQLTYIIVPTF
jgi:hypothetical protein